MEKEKVLITGGSGYLGSVITGHLLRNGYMVTCLDNLMYRQKSLMGYFGDENFEYIHGDARDEELLRKIVPEFDVIIPLAAIVGMPAGKLKPIESTTTNRDAVLCEGL